MKNGFTLMELMITIAIIGILVVVSINSLSSTKGKSRDARRVSEMEALRDATEKYIQDNYKLPGVITDLSSCFNSGNFPDKDPNGVNYIYFPASPTYYIGAKMEVISASGANICPPAVMTANPGVNYCLTRTN